MNKLIKILTIIIFSILFISWIGSVAILYGYSIQCSSFFASGTLSLGICFGYLVYPIVINTFKKNK